MNAIFVAGTDTGVGKTFVTKLIARRLSARGCKVATQKWVETGVRKSRAVYSFRMAASPHLAARREKKAIDIKKIKAALKKLSKKNDIVIVEGTGGLLVPLTGKKLLIDVVKALKIPVLLVSANRLGAINQTLLSIEALRARKMALLGVVFNNIPKKENALILKDNPKIVKKFIGSIPVWING
ncbi:MAG: dethiobiotin synthase [Candidatus Omnitrophica bacterium]|nr:dethiobiotin synthase [Candidatus Omnitrophota bacterium]MDD5437184.1 dethiobiotin synthase [Candidatus Omnitrophota bacterium]